MSEPDFDAQLQSRQAHGSRRDRGSLTLAGRACAGELAPGQAMTLRVRRAGHLQIRGERVWLTLWLAFQDASVRGGDHFVEAGQQVALRAHQAVVIEPCARSGQVCRCAQFQWQPASGTLGAVRQGLAHALRTLADRIARPTLLART